MDLLEYIDKLELNKVKISKDRFMDIINNSNKYEYRELIKEFESDSNSFDDGLSQIRFYLSLIILTRNKNNDIEVIMSLFNHSINIMNYLPRLRDRNHVLVEITNNLLCSKDEFDKSDLVKEIIKTVSKISEQNDPDLCWIVRSIKESLAKSDYKEFLNKF